MHQDCSSNKMGQFPRKEQLTCIDFCRQKTRANELGKQTEIAQDIVEKLLEDNSWRQSNSTNF